jgi:hypothetical protein
VTGDIANRTYRLAQLNELAAKMMEELRLEPKLKGSVGLLRELREYHKQAAIECGDWSEKQEVTVKPAEPSEDYSKIPLEILQAALEKMREARSMLTIEAAVGTV